VAPRRRPRRPVPDARGRGPLAGLAILGGAFLLSWATELAEQGLPLDARQSEELWLPSAQSLFAVLIVADLRFRRAAVVVLAVLFLGQLLFPDTSVRVGAVSRPP